MPKKAFTPLQIRMNKENKRFVTGFTLVELLIVIIIIGILATMAVPQYNKMVENSKIAQAYVKMDVLRKAEIVYYMEFNGWFDINNPEVQPKYDNGMLALNLNPSDFSGDKYYQYWWGTLLYTTPDGKSHASGLAIAAKVASDGSRTNDSLFLFNDDMSVWRAKLNSTGSFNHFEDRVR